MIKFFLICKGLPASGKSSLAKLITDKVVNRDTIREQLGITSQNWTKKLEKEKVIPERNRLLGKYFQENNSIVVCDDTNLNEDVVDQLKAIADSYGYQSVIVDLTNVPVQTCVERDCARQKKVGVEVIAKFAKLLPNIEGNKGPNVTPYKFKSSRKCIIVDLDGTVADINHRNPYDTSKLLLDTPRKLVLQAVKEISFENDAKIFFFSGREGTDQVKQDTARWFSQHATALFLNHGTTFHFRTPGDKRRDSIIKNELFEQYVSGEYEVIAVFDDRPQVLNELWYKLFPYGSSTTIFSVGNGREF
jgi:predicted kinase